MPPDFFYYYYYQLTNTQSLEEEDYTPEDYTDF